MLFVLAPVVALATVTFAKSIPRPAGVAKGPGFVQLPLVAVNKTGPVVQKRQATSLYNIDGGTAYQVQLSVGTPAQPVYLSLDTGSSETWVDPDCSTANVPSQVAECNSYPRYDPNLSSTAVDQGSTFYLSYGKGYSSGEYLTDNFVVGGALVAGLQFGWADASAHMEMGIIAVGYGVEITGYYCLVDQMFVNGVINSRAFSMDLGSVDTPTGQLVFGGIDTKKYTGNLAKRPIIPAADAPDQFTRYWVYMTSVGITKPGTTTSKIYTVPQYNQAVVLDSGSTLSTLPSNLVAAMLSDFTGVVSQGGGVYTVDCSQKDQSGTLDFGFGNVVINVPYHQFIWGGPPGLCFFGAVAADPATYDTWILGDTMLRAAYTVFDQDNDNVWIAPYVNCGTNIVPIGSGVNAVPSLAGQCTKPAPSSTSTLTSKTSSTKTTTSSSTTTSKSTSSKSTSSTKTNTSSSTTTTSKSTSSKSTSSTKTTTSSSKATTTSQPTTSKTSTSTSTKPTSTTKSSTLVTTTTSKASTTSTTSASTATKTLGYTYVGCFKDSKPAAMTSILSGNSMNVELCLSVAHAASPPYPYAGLENGSTCVAALTTPAAATTTSGRRACTKTCAGNALETCGASGQYDLYHSAP